MPNKLVDAGMADRPCEEEERRRYYALPSAVTPLDQPEKMNHALRILVLADTHDHLPEGLDALAYGTDEIWHLGDVCAPALLRRLREIGPPVTIVLGNCDAEEWPLVVDLERNGVRFRLIHIPPLQVPTDTDVVLHGHTHVPRDECRGTVRFLNPGCVTRPNRGAPASVAHLEIAADGSLSWNLTRLRERARRAN